MKDEYIVVVDSQFMFPVLLSSIPEGSSPGLLSEMDGDDYGDWCAKTVMPEGMEVGTQECIDFCNRLLEEGADRWDVE